MNCEFLVRREEINEMSFRGRIFSVVFPRTAVWCYVIASYLGSTIKWSYDKMLIDWVRSGGTGKYLSLGQDSSQIFSRPALPLSQ